MPKLKHSLVLGVAGESFEQVVIDRVLASSTASARSTIAVKDRWKLSQPSAPSDKSTLLKITQTRWCAFNTIALHRSDGVSLTCFRASSWEKACSAMQSERYNCLDYHGPYCRIRR
jgi:hypothetical protein